LFNLILEGAVPARTLREGREGGLLYEKGEVTMKKWQHIPLEERELI